MYQKNEHIFEGLYIGHFWLELKKLGQAGPLELRNFKNGQKFGVYRMYQQNKHNFEGLYLSHFWLELKKLGQGFPLDLTDF